MLLRDHLLAQLATLPGERRFHLHVLFTTPRKHSRLFPYVKSRPKILVQEILILLSEQEHKNDEYGPNVFVSVIEAMHYTIPSTSSSILYVSKVDSTGQGIAPSPTSKLVRSFLAFYANPKTRPTDNLWIHVFARAQGQYLFPNSSDFPGKRVLSDSKLCSWWKRVLTAVSNDSSADPSSIEAYYVLPGMGELEALQSLGEAVEASGGSTEHPPARLKWHYGHPYTPKTTAKMPLGLDASDTARLVGELIPSFPDDPKARFMDELSVTKERDTLPISPMPPAKRAKTSSTTNSVLGKEDDKKEEGEAKSIAITADEFWERMSFRQECVSGAATGFFVVAFRLGEGDEAIKDGEDEKGEVSEQTMTRIVSSLTTGHEFSTAERAVRATEILSGAIRGLCEGLPDRSRRSGETQPENPERDRAEEGLLPDDPDPLSLHIYTRFIYASISVDNPNSSVRPATPPPPPVTMLTVRRKRKKQ
ncbi:hypothetical protein SISSUDRAFT_1069331 [Sistotremastrum suecicum HHB10207 ss-3]|uniref:histone acetyltransferase n=1 Tax=Sistotremastrum suecicum HHB10207 ss-3 TaxID=1314776 RepID=A0A166HFV0_9AGAM|nr:hypothetical protein SISSUDRAFT_1069331 [Sistotremastrum suecicum HHB10207 ss-3]